jgi:glycosyltransferase involved in cell wall biosynthesis
VVGCREVVRDGVEGLLVPGGDLDAAAGAIARLAADAGLRARLGEAANRRFRERFTEQAVRAIVTDLYLRAVPAAGLAPERGRIDAAPG